MRTTFRKIVRRCPEPIFAFVVLCLLLTAPLRAKIGDIWWAFSGKAPELTTQADKEFADAVNAVAILPKREDSGVTQAFQQMADRLSLEGFRNYVFDRYNGSHGRSAYGVHDMINVPRSELRRYNRTFGWNQWLRIVFRYADDGRTLVGFHAMVITDFL